MKKIAILSQPEYFKLHYLDFLLYSDYNVREFILKFDASIEEYKELLKFNPDVLICFRGEFVSNDLLSKLKCIKIALSSEPFPRLFNGVWSYSKDSLQRYQVFQAIREKDFDYVFHYDKYSKELFNFDGMQLSGYFNFPISTKSIFPEQVNKKWDISFIGRSSERRENIMTYLKHHYNFIHIAHGLVGSDINYYLNRSLISLNIHASNEVSWEPRLQILMASGCVVFSERIIPNDILIKNKHYISFDDNNDLYEKIAYYLADSQRLQNISKEARALMEKSFSSLDYFNDLIKNIELYPKFKIYSSRNKSINLMVGDIKGLIKNNILNNLILQKIINSLKKMKRFL